MVISKNSFVLAFILLTPINSYSEPLCYKSDGKESNEKPLKDIKALLKDKKDVYVETNYNYHIMSTTDVISFPNNSKGNYKGKRGPIDKDLFIGYDSKLRVDQVYGCIIKLKKEVIIKNIKDDAVTIPKNRAMKIKSITYSSKKYPGHQDYSLRVSVEDGRKLIDYFECTTYEIDKNEDFEADYMDGTCSNWLERFGVEKSIPFLQFGNGEGKEVTYTAAPKEEKTQLATNIYDQKRSLIDSKKLEVSDSKMCSTKSI